MLHWWKRCHTASRLSQPPSVRIPTSCATARMPFWSGYETPNLAEGLRCLLDDRSLAEKVGRGDRKLFEECLEISEIEKHFHDIYEDLLQGAPSPRDAVDRAEPGAAETAGQSRGLV